MFRMHAAPRQEPHVHSSPAARNNIFRPPISTLHCTQSARLGICTTVSPAASVLARARACHDTNSLSGTRRAVLHHAESSSFLLLLLLLLFPTRAWRTNKGLIPPTSSPTLAPAPCCPAPCCPAPAAAAIAHGPPSNGPTCGAAPRTAIHHQPHQHTQHQYFESSSTSGRSSSSTTSRSAP